ncbi:MAG: hypothetical protein ACREL9_12785, partial [Gemmatimonadales bacterium]
MRVLLALLLVVPGSLLAQADVATRLAGRVPPSVAAAVQELAATTRVRGLPVEPLIQKAIEGAAKGVAPERVIAAVRALAGRLDVAASALRAANIPAPDAPAVEAGAFALNAGLSDPQLTALALATPPPHDLAATLRVAGTLAAMGVPAAQTVELVTQIIQAGRPPTDVLDLPAQVQAG